MTEGWTPERMQAVARRITALGKRLKGLSKEERLECINRAALRVLSQPFAEYGDGFLTTALIWSRTDLIRENRAGGLSGLPRQPVKAAPGPPDGDATPTLTAAPSGEGGVRERRRGFFVYLDAPVCDGTASLHERLLVPATEGDLGSTDQMAEFGEKLLELWEDFLTRATARRRPQHQESYRATLETMESIEDGSVTMKQLLGDRVGEERKREQRRLHQEFSRARRHLLNLLPDEPDDPVGSTFAISKREALRRCVHALYRQDARRRASREARP